MSAFRYRIFIFAVFLTFFIGPGQAALAAGNEPSLSRLQQLSAQGDAEAQYLLAQRYRKGDGVGQDFNRAMQLVEKSARQGYAPAQYQMGIVYLIGKGMKKDRNQAVKWLDKAARQDSPSAQYVLGNIYIEDMRETHLAEGVKLIKKAAPRDPRALCTLGVLTLKGIGVEKDPPAAFEMFKTSASKGWAEAASYGAIMMIEGVGTTKRVQFGKEVLTDNARRGEKTAIGYLMFEARNGQSWAQVLMAECLLGGCRGVDKAPAEAKQWLNKAAAQGDAKAMFYLGDLYSSEGDAGKTLHWYKLAAKAGSARADMQLARFYESGKLVKRDPAAAIRWYGRAADAGDSAARTHLLNLFSPLRETEEIEKVGSAAMGAALEWLRKRAVQGDIEAQATLGLALMSGRGAPQDTAAAVGWLKKAAMHGNYDAQMGLRTAYLRGQGVTRDRVHALAWWMVAKRQDVDSLNSFARRHESPETLREADELARRLRGEIAANGG